MNLLNDLFIRGLLWFSDWGSSYWSIVNVLSKCLFVDWCVVILFGFQHSDYIGLLA